MSAIKKDYKNLAIVYCEKYGIINYKLNKNLLIYNVSYHAYLGSPHYTIQHTINLDDMSHSSKQLKRYDANGIYNRN